MADQQCRVTVVGRRRRVDLAVPAGAPIGEYVTTLADLCGEEDSEVMPLAWTLGVPGQRPLPQTLSLADVGAVDGQVLYLRDATSGEYDEPAILELEDLVAEAADTSGGPRWDSPVRSATVVAVGVCWLVAGIGWQVFAAPSTSVSAVFAGAAGLFLPLLAWLAGRNGWLLGDVATQLLALGAVPALAATGWLLGHSALGLPFGLILTGVGAAVGALAALIAKPGVGTIGALPVMAVGALTTALVVALHADALAAAGTVALVGTIVLGVAPWAAGHLVTFLATPPSSSTSDDKPGAPVPATDPQVREAITNFVRARRLLAGWTVLTGVVLAVTLAELATSGNDFAAGIVVCLAIALLWRAAGYLLMLEALPVVVAAGTGLFVLATRVPTMLSGVSASAGVVLAGMTGSMIIILGIALSFRRDTEPAPRRAAARVLATTAVVATVPLLLGLYGALDQLFHLGRVM